MITPQQGLALMRQVQQMQAPGGSGPGAPPAGSPTQGLIARLMSDNPGGLIGALTGGGNAPVNPGAAPGAGAPAYVPGGQGPMAGGPAAPQPGMLAGLLAKLKGQQPMAPMGGAPGGMPPQSPTPMMPDAGAMSGGW